MFEDVLSGCLVGFSKPNPENKKQPIRLTQLPIPVRMFVPSFFEAD